MVRVATCPYCMQPVSIPPGLEPDCRVRCPICEAEYLLTEAIVEAEDFSSSEPGVSLEPIQQEPSGPENSPLPPELIPVAASSGESEQFYSGTSEEEKSFLTEAASHEEEPLLTEGSQAQPQELGAETEESPFLEEISAQEEVEEVSAPIASEEEVSAEAVGLEQTAAEAVSSELSESELTEGQPTEEAISQEPPPLDLDPLVRSPFSSEPFPLSQLIIDATGDPIGQAAAAMIVRQGLLRPISEEEAAEMASAEAPSVEEAREAFDFSSLAVAGEGVAPAAAPISARPRKHAEVNPVKEMIGIVLGGAMGLLIGYYLLNFFGGARFNFLEIYLPGVKHTYKYAPSWLPQWAKWGVPSASESPEPSESLPPEKKNNRSSPLKLTPSQSEPPVSPTEKQTPQPQEASLSGSSDTGAAQPKGTKPKARPGGKSASADKSAFRLEVTGAASYSSEDLGQALQEVQEVFGCKQCNSTGQQTKTVTEVQQVDGQPKEISRQVTVPCEACKGQPPKTITEESFRRFCRLAEVVCFVTGPEDKGFLKDRRFAARTLLERVAEEPTNPEKIGAQAAAVWHDAGRLSMGLLAAGQLGRRESHGRWEQYELQLAGTDRKIPLLLNSSPPAEQGDSVLVLGCIVEEPANNLRAYSGGDSMVMVGAVVVKIP